MDPNPTYTHRSRTGAIRNNNQAAPGLNNGFNNNAFVGDDQQTGSGVEPGPKGAGAGGSGGGDEGVYVPDTRLIFNNCVSSDRIGDVGGRLSEEEFRSSSQDFLSATTNKTAAAFVGGQNNSLFSSLQQQHHHNYQQQQQQQLYEQQAASEIAATINGGIVGPSSSGNKNSVVDMNSLYKLEALSERWQFYLAILYSVTAVTSFVLNVLTVIVLSRIRRSELRKYLINLSVSDLLMSLFSIPFTYTEYMLGRWIFAAFLCPVVRFVVTLSVFVSVATMTVIGINRHSAIMHPLRKGKSNKFRAWILRKNHVIAIIWLIGIAISMPEYLMFKAELFCYNKEYYHDCRIIWPEYISDQYTVFIYLITFVIPLSILSYLYTRIGLKLWRRQMPGNVDVNRDLTMQTMRVKIIKMLFVVVMLFAISWLPLQTFSMFLFLFPEIRENFEYQSIKYNIFIGTYFACHWLSMAHSCLNPLIYCFMNDKFRGDLKELLLKRRKSFITNHHQQTTTSLPNNNNLQQNNNNNNNNNNCHHQQQKQHHQQQLSKNPRITIVMSSDNTENSNPAAPREDGPRQLVKLQTMTTSEKRKVKGSQVSRSSQDDDGILSNGQKVEEKTAPQRDNSSRDQGPRSNVETRTPTQTKAETTTMAAAQGRPGDFVGEKQLDIWRKSGVQPSIKDVDGEQINIHSDRPKAADIGRDGAERVNRSAGPEVGAKLLNGTHSSVARAKQEIGANNILLFSRNQKNIDDDGEFAENGKRRRLNDADVVNYCDETKDIDNNSGDEEQEEEEEELCESKFYV